MIHEIPEVALLGRCELVEHVCVFHLMSDCYTGSQEDQAKLWVFLAEADMDLVNILNLLLTVGIFALFGAMVGVAQWLILSTRAQRAGWLVLLNGVAGAAAGLVLVLVGTLLESLLPRILPINLALILSNLLALGTAGGAYGAITGTVLQHLILPVSKGADPSPSSSAFLGLPRG